MATTAASTAAPDDFASLLDDFRPAPTTIPASAWDGPIPQSVRDFVELCYTTRTPRERKMTDAAAADKLTAVIRAACDDHEPKLSARIVRTYAPLVKDGKPVNDDDGKPVDDTDKLESVRISVSKYSPRGGGVKGKKEDTPAAAKPKTTPKSV